MNVTSPMSLDQVIEDLRRRYDDQRPQSRTAQAQARRLIPGGTSRSVLAIRPFPFRVARAEGAVIHDVDGHTYVDLCGDYTAGLLGHSPEAVRSAVADVLERGWAYGASPPHEVAAAQLMHERFPSMEAIRFVNSGTEANLLAIALAQRFTGRHAVVAFRNGFHGSLLAFNAGGGPGPLNVPHQFRLATYNSTASAFEALDAGDVACVLVEPMQGAGGCVVGSRPFLAHLRRACTKYGALLVFDEVMTSRLAPGGLQRQLGIVPDITTVGKYLAGGLGFGAAGGRADVFRCLDPEAPDACAHSGTFNNNAFAMASVCAVLETELSPDVIERVNRRGDRLRARLCEATASSHADGVEVSGHGSMLHLRTADPRVLEWAFHHLLDAGVYIGPTGMLSVSVPVTDEMIDQLVAAFEAWCAQLAGFQRGGGHA